MNTPLVLTSLERRESALMRQRRVVDDARLTIAETLRNTGISAEYVKNMAAAAQMDHALARLLEPLLEAAGTLLIVQDALNKIDQGKGPEPKECDA